MKNLEKSLQSVREIYVEVPKEYELVENALRNADNEIQDLMHFIELGALDAVAMSKTVKQLKKVRQERRILKNELEVLEEIKRFVSIKNPRNHEFNKVVGRVRKIMETQERRIYTMKVRKDLQEFVR